MSATSNSVFLTAYTPHPADGAGWEVHVLDKDFATLLTIVPEFSALSIGPELNDAGTGSITVNLDTPFWDTLLTNGAPASTLLDYEYVWEAWEDGKCQFQWLGETVEELIDDESENRTATISGPGVAAALKWAVILRPGWPAGLPATILANTTGKTVLGSATDKTPAGTWQFPVSWPAMRMWFTLLASAQKRGVVPWVKPKFTATKDSGGVPWSVIITTLTYPGTQKGGNPLAGFQTTNGETLFDFLNDCTAQDYATWFAEFTEWVMWPGYILDVRPTIGTDKSTTVRFYEGADVHIERTRVRDEIHNYVVMESTNHDTGVASSPSSAAHWNRREILEAKYGNVTDATRRTLLAQTYLKKYEAQKSQWTLTVPYDQPGRRPFRDYKLGDLISISRTNPSTGTETIETYRVMAITVSVTTDPLPTVELVLESKLDMLQRVLDKKITTIINTGNTSTTDADLNLPTDTTTTDTTNTTVGPGTGAYTHVFIQPTDPAASAVNGDFWYDTDYQAPPTFTYVADPPAPAEVGSAKIYHHG